MNPLKALSQRGQFVWLDYISRSLITGGGLQRLIDEDGLGGVTSNPTIFHTAITESADYAAGMHRVLDAGPHVSNRAAAERLIAEDIQLAAEVLRPVYDGSDGANGFVSLEVSPGSAHDTGATVAEARHLWKTVARPNVMIKVPATQEGVIRESSRCRRGSSARGHRFAGRAISAGKSCHRDCQTHLPPLP